MIKNLNRRFCDSVNIFGDRTRVSYDEVECVGTPAELSELIKTEPYVYAKFPKKCKKNANLVAELSSLNLLPTRMEWESDDVYFDGWNLIVYDHGEPRAAEYRDFRELSPVFTFSE